MAVFNQLSAGDISSIDDMQKVRDYLYKLNKNLKYMFNNLTPEDNYSELARLTMVTDGQRQATIEATLEGISLNYVSKDNVISAINLSEGLAKIEAEKIQLEGVVTVNGYFKVGLDGSITAKNGKFNGDISASNISGSTIEGSHIYASYYGSRTANDFFIIAEDDVTVVGAPGFEFKNRKMTSNWIGGVENPALENSDQAGINGGTGDAGFRKLYLLDDWYEGQDGTFWDVTRTLRWLDDRISALEARCWTDCDDSDDCGSDGCPGDACMCDGSTDEIGDNCS